MNAFYKVLKTEKKKKKVDVSYGYNTILLGRYKNIIENMIYLYRKIQRT